MADEVRSAQSIMDNVLKVIKNPTGFYKQMPKEGGLTQPVLFLAAMTLTGFLVMLVGKALILRAADVTGGIIMLIVIPTIIIVASFITAAILFGIWKILGSEESYETAYRCMAYTYSILPIASVLVFIPVIGAIIGTVWMAYLLITASVHVHKIKPPMAWLVWGLITLLFIGVNLSFEMGSRSATDKLTKEGYKMEQMKEEIMKEVEEAQKKMPE